MNFIKIDTSFFCINTYRCHIYSHFLHTKLHNLNYFSKNYNHFLTYIILKTNAILLLLHYSKSDLKLGSCFRAKNTYKKHEKNL